MVNAVPQRYRDNNTKSRSESPILNPYKEIEMMQQSLHKRALELNEIAVKRSGRREDTDPRVHCENYDGRINWINMTCPNCGQMYCMHCWGKWICNTQENARIVGESPNMMFLPLLKKIMPAESIQYQQSPG